MPLTQTWVGELNRLLGDQPFIGGAELSLVDLMLAPRLDFFPATPEGRDLLKSTALVNWLARMNQRPSMRRTQRPENLRGAA